MMNCSIALSKNILMADISPGNTGVGRHWPYVACIPIRYGDVVAIFRVEHAGSIYKWGDMGVARM